MNQSIIIIGSGIAGLSLALFLKKAGIHCTVYENKPFQKQIGSSLRINRSGVKVLDSLGLTKKIENNSFSAEKLKVIAPNNIEAITINLMQSKNYRNRSITMQRSDLMKVLLEKAAEEHIQIQYNKKLIEYHQDQDGVVAKFDDGTQAYGPLLVGADGLHSTTRKQTFPSYTLKYAHSWALYGAVSSKEIDIHINTSMLDTDELLYIKKNAGFFIARSHPNSYYDISWQASGYQERKLAYQDFEWKTQAQLKKDILHCIADDWDGFLPDMISKSKIIPKQLYTTDPLPSLSKDRVVIIGDAAHTINPNTGYGSSVALEDAMYLAKMLRDYQFKDAFYYFEFDRKERIGSINSSLSTFDISQGLDFNKGFDIGILSGSKIDPDYTVEW
ncbi:FAD-dependent monooxygenase [Bacillus sp. 28A-2]|uniref:FAD-dependent oxidoreductase n=1 Tax=Bacillus sp. 28A-2 TaxID=2772252 RepID=UPI00168CBCFC|nr:NAD(P)/FAD-dependent oxidoreductase [Bacillus sp. 28A-2]MBD3861623.1 FAD-dependent monooxygenase [Bacillus sp. 28A-2]